MRLVEIEVPIRSLPPALDGLRVAHLSDLHLGPAGLNRRSLRRGIDLVRDRAPDIAFVTGDLRAHRAGDHGLRAELSRLAPPLGGYAVLGNHDFAGGRTPFRTGSQLDDVDGTGFRLLHDEAVAIERDGAAMAIGGIHPRTHRQRGRARRRPRTPLRPVPDADLRVLLCHYPDVFDRLAPGSVDLVLAGHLHGGQICLPYPGGKRRMAHGVSRYQEGVYGREGMVMHVSRGTGTTFVPFRFAARPEVTLLVLRRSA